MEAKATDSLPAGPEWVYEHKYDGFRCIGHIAAGVVSLRSKAAKDLLRYFPEIGETLAGIDRDAILDGEILPQEGDFEELQLRLNPAKSRVASLSREAPAEFVAFDLLGIDGRSLLATAFGERRGLLEKLLATKRPGLRISRQTKNLKTATAWIGKKGLDGVMAKHLGLPYRPGKRDMLKYKIWRRVDCVVGGYYEAQGRAQMLLLGLHDAAGRLSYVGACRLGFDTRELTELLASIRTDSAFTGRRPPPSDRWSGAARSPVFVAPKVVAEVETDHVSRDFMRHGARLCHFRPDKAPEACLMTQFHEPIAVPQGRRAVQERSS